MSPRRGAALAVGAVLVSWISGGASSMGTGAATAGGPSASRADDLRFTRVVSGPAVTDSGSSPAASWVDVDGDGDEDLYVLNGFGSLEEDPAPQRNFLYRNDGSGGFTAVPGHPLVREVAFSGSATWADLDNDGDLDLVIAVWGGASEIYRNDGEGRLYPAAAGDLGGAVSFASSVSASDIDADGDLDLYLTQWPINEAGGAPNLLFRNDGKSGNWIRVELEGTSSNRSGVGARIVVVTSVDGEERRQLRQVSSRTSWRSAGGHARHFGLAGAEAVDRIEVLWPSGETQVVTGPLPFNRTLTIRERRR